MNRTIFIGAAALVLGIAACNSTTTPTANVLAGAWGAYDAAVTTEIAAIEAGKLTGAAKAKAAADRQAAFHALQTLNAAYAAGGSAAAELAAFNLAVAALAADAQK